MILRIVGDGDAFVARERADHDVGVRPARRACGSPGWRGRRCRRRNRSPTSSIGTPADLGAGESVERGVGRVRRRPRLVDHRQRRAGDDVFVEAAEGALALGHDAEPNAVAGRCRAVVGAFGSGVVGRFGGRASACRRSCRRCRPCWPRCPRRPCRCRTIVVVAAAGRGDERQREDGTECPPCSRGFHGCSPCGWCVALLRSSNSVVMVRPVVGQATRSTARWRRTVSAERRARPSLIHGRPSARARCGLGR